MSSLRSNKENIDPMLKSTKGSFKDILRNSNSFSNINSIISNNNSEKDILRKSSNIEIYNTNITNNNIYSQPRKSMFKSGILKTIANINSNNKFKLNSNNNYEFKKNQSKNYETLSTIEGNLETIEEDNIHLTDSSSESDACNNKHKPKNEDFNKSSMCFRDRVMNEQIDNKHQNNLNKSFVSYKESNKNNNKLSKSNINKSLNKTFSSQTQKLIPKASFTGSCNLNNNFLNDSIYLETNLGKSYIDSNDNFDIEKVYSKENYDNKENVYGMTTILTSARNIDVAKSLVEKFKLHESNGRANNKVFERKCKYGLNVLYKENEVKPKHFYDYFN